MDAPAAAPDLAPLAGLRVLELGSDVSLAFAARLLADLGAEVLRPDPPGGDPLRAAAPETEAGSALFAYLNHGKTLLAADAVSVAVLARQADLLLWAPEAPGGGALGAPARRAMPSPPSMRAASPGTRPRRSATPRLSRRSAARTAKRRCWSD